MKFLTLLFPLFFLQSVLAVPFHTLDDRDLGLSIRGDQHNPSDSGGHGEDSLSLEDHPWIPADYIPDASRSPCPFLNTMSNHGFLKRDGRNLRMDDFENTMVKAVNFDTKFIREVFTIPQFQKLGILGPNQTHTDVTIDLVDLNFHNHNEHDASMSRLDKIQGDTLHVQPALVEKILCDTVPADYPYLNTSSIGRTRVRRENDSRAAGSGEPDSNVTIKPGIAEGALALMFVGEGGFNPDKLFVRKERLREWMDYERIPQGWKRSEKVVTTEDFNSLFGSVHDWRIYWS